MEGIVYERFEAICEFFRICLSVLTIKSINNLKTFHTVGVK